MESEGKMFNPIFKGRNIQEVVHLKKQNYLLTESLNVKFKIKVL